MKFTLMRNKIARNLIWEISFFSGILFFLSFLKKTKAKGIIFCYHNLSIESQSDDVYLVHLNFSIFQKQILLLRKYFYFTKLSHFFSEMHELKKPLAVITFDDGYKGVLELGFPFLKKLNIPATVFICTDPTLRGVAYPWDLLRRWAALKKGVEKEFIYKLNSLLLSIPGDKRWKIYKEMFKEKLPEVMQELRPLYMSVSDIKCLLSEGWEVGAHTVSHPYLTEIADEQKKAEIAKCKQELEDLLGIEIPYFAYPAGRYDQITKKMVQDSGYKLAFSLDNKVIFTGDTDMFCVSRVGCGNIKTKGELYAKATGIHPYWYRKT